MVMLCVSGWHTHYCLSLNCWNYRVIAWSKLGPSLANTCQVQIGNVCPQSQLDHPLSRNIEIKHFVFNDGNFFEIFEFTVRVNLRLLRSTWSRRPGAVGRESLWQVCSHLVCLHAKFGDEWVCAKSGKERGEACSWESCNERGLGPTILNNDHPHQQTG